MRQEHDPINHPSHYTHGPIEVIDLVEGFNLGFHEGNAIKYLLRWRHKDGLQDLKKARWYLDRLIQVEEAAGSDKAEEERIFSH